MKKTVKLPDDFFLGAAASAWQTEGGLAKKNIRIRILIYGIQRIKMFGIMVMVQLSLQIIIIVIKKILVI